MFPQRIGDRPAIKICGLRTPADAVVAADAGADAIGVVLVPSSPRYVTDVEAGEIINTVGESLPVVSVVRDPPPPDAASRFGSFVQLHGREAPAILDTHRFGVPIIKALAFDAAQLLAWDAYGLAALLVDSPDAGSGEAFDYGPLIEIREQLRTPLILAGGLTPDTVAKAVRRVRPDAVDVSSGVESSRGVKDPGRIRAFCDAVRG